MVQAIAPAPTDTFIEIGPGAGALTRPLAATGARVVAVEIDRDLAARLAADAPPNLTVVTGDFLALDVMEALAAARAPHPDAAVPPGAQPGAAAVRVVGNLPYSISTPILLRILELHQRHRVFRDATLMVQKEVADRLVAAPGSRDYGVLSVFVQLHAEVTPLLGLPPGAFRPAPKVRSTLVRLAFRPRPVAVNAPDVFARLVRGVFTKRRKTLLNAFRPVAEAFGLEAGEVLAQAAIDPGRRPETLGLAELARLAELLASAPGRAVL